MSSLVKNIFGKLKGDQVIWLIVLGLSVFSLLAVYSSTESLAFKEHNDSLFYYLAKHLFVMCLGLAIMYISHLVNYKYYSRVAQIFLWLSIPLLLYTLVFGTDLNDARRWITLPIINLTFQTSDFAKLALIMYTARILARKQGDIKNFKEAYLPTIIPVVIVCLLIAPADLSSAAVLFATCTLIMFIGRVSISHLLLTFGAGMAALLLLVGVLSLSSDSGRLQTWKNRIEDFKTNKDGPYQVQHAKIAIAKGGIVRLAPGLSTQRNYLPHPYSDFIYAIIIEEYGLVGGLLILLLYLALLYRCVLIVLSAPRAFGAFLAVGLAFSLVIQAFINMAVNVHLLPVTGLTLPMVSMGGTSLWFTGLSIGIILSVSKNAEELKAQQILD